MAIAQVNGPNVETQRREVISEVEHETWAHWPVRWTAVWVGTLAAVTAVLLFGLIGIALGAQVLNPDQRVVDLKKIGLLTLAFSIFAAFLSFVIGGWVAGKIAGILRSEPAMLHGAIVWLVAVPILVVLGALGAGSYLGGWNAGLAGSAAGTTSSVAPFNRPDPLTPGATQAEITQYKADQAEYNQKVKQWQEESPRVARNSALGALTALLLGLVGSVIGGWMASGEPMTLTYNRTRLGTRPTGQPHHA